MLQQQRWLKRSHQKSPPKHQMTTPKSYTLIDFCPICRQLSGSENLLSTDQLDSLFWYLLTFLTSERELWDLSCFCLTRHVILCVPPESDEPSPLLLRKCFSSEEIAIQQPFPYLPLLICSFFLIHCPPSCFCWFQLNHTILPRDTALKCFLRILQSLNNIILGFECLPLLRINRVSELACNTILIHINIYQKFPLILY